MKRLIPSFLLLCLFIWTGASCPNNKTVFQTIKATEEAVLAANGAYLDAVVTGQIKTNGVPQVEAAFNDTQMALHSAAVVASGGINAPVPQTVLAKATAFTNTITLNSIKP